MELRAPGVDDDGTDELVLPADPAASSKGARSDRLSDLRSISLSDKVLDVPVKVVEQCTLLQVAVSLARALNVGASLNVVVILLWRILGGTEPSARIRAANGRRTDFVAPYASLWGLGSGLKLMSDDGMLLTRADTSSRPSQLVLSAKGKAARDETPELTEWFSKILSTAPAAGGTPLLQIEVEQMHLSQNDVPHLVPWSGDGTGAELSIRDALMTLAARTAISEWRDGGCVGPSPVKDIFFKTMHFENLLRNRDRCTRARVEAWAEREARVKTLSAEAPAPHSSGLWLGVQHFLFNAAATFVGGIFFPARFKPEVFATADAYVSAVVATAVACWRSGDFCGHRGHYPNLALHNAFTKAWTMGASDATKTNLRAMRHMSLAVQRGARLVNVTAEGLQYIQDFVERYCAPLADVFEAAPSIVAVGRATLLWKEMVRVVRTVAYFREEFYARELTHELFGGPAFGHCRPLDEFKFSPTGPGWKHFARRLPCLFALRPEEVEGKRRRASRTDPHGRTEADYEAALRAFHREACDGLWAECCACFGVVAPAMRPTDYEQGGSLVNKMVRARRNAFARLAGTRPPETHYCRYYVPTLL